MKKLIVLIISVFFNANLYLAQAEEQPREPLITRNFPASSINSVEASTSGGSISISGDAGSEAVVEVYVSHNRWSNEQIRQSLEEDYTIDIEVRNGKLHVTAKRNRASNNQGLSISYKIRVPQQVNTNLQTSGGSINISNLTGSQDFRTSGGSLTVDRVTGKITGRTSGGSINVSNSSDAIDLRTSGGSINARNCSGDITLQTSGGGVNLTNVNGNISATTSGGSITANNVIGELKTGTSGGSVNLNGISGSVDAKTSGGRMSVTMEAVNNFVKLSNSGNITLTLPAEKGYNLNVRANSNIQTSELNNFRGNVNSRRLEGTVANGGPEIDVTATRVNLSFK